MLKLLGKIRNVATWFVRQDANGTACFECQCTGVSMSQDVNALMYRPTNVSKCFPLQRNKRALRANIIYAQKS